MKRDMDLIRKILLRIEESPDFSFISPFDIEGYETEQISYHIELLDEAGLIKAKEGRGGGYSLAKKPAKISVAEVVEILEGPVQVGACSSCPQAAMCGQKDVWTEVRDKVQSTIEDKTLRDLI